MELNTRSSFAAVVAMGLMAAFVGCGARSQLGVGNDLDADGGTISDASVTPDVSLAQQFVLSAKPTTLTMTQRKPPVSLSVHVQRLNRFAGTIEVAYGGLTTGLTGTKAVLPAGVDDGVLQISAADTSDQGPLAGVYLSGTSSGAVEQKVPLDLFVRGCPGCIDKTFAEKGRATPLGVDNLGGIAVDPSDRIVFTAMTFSPRRCVVGRLTKDGDALDPSFGVGGLTVISTDPNCFVTGIAATANNVVSLSTISDNAAMHTEIHRLNANGSLDTAFAAGGLFSEPTPNGTFYSVLVDAQGRVTAAGSSDYSNDATAHIVRLLADGTPDPSFGTGGRIHTPWLGQGTVNQIVLGGNDRLLAAGASIPPINGPQLLTLAGYLSSGSPDTAFGAQGISASGFPTNFSGSTAAAGIVVAKDGNIWSAAQIYSGGGRAALARFHPDGTLDASLDPQRFLFLDKAGQAITYTTGLYQESTGDILVVGGAIGLKPDDPQPAMLWRVHLDGTYDPEFGIQGVATFLLAQFTYLGWSALQSDGRIVLGGHTYDTQKPTVAVIVRVWN